MTIKTAASLKSFFEKGDRPSEVQFIDLIDSTYSGEIGAALVSAAAAGSTGLFQVDSASAVSFVTTGSAGLALVSAGTQASARTVLGALSAGDGIFQIDTVASVRTFISAASDASASTTQAGLIELATTAEATAGTDATRAITPATLAVASPAATLPTPIVTTSGTAITITGIASNAKEVTVTFAGVSTNGTSLLELTLGPVAGVETTGYVGGTTRFGVGAGAGTAWPTDAITVDNAVLAAETLQGSIILTLHDAATNAWTVSGTTAHSGTVQVNVVAGSKSLAGPLERIQLTTAGGTDTFDAGSINVLVKA